MGATVPNREPAPIRSPTRLDAETDVSSAIKDCNIQRTTDYVLGVVLFSVALFFAGMSMKLPAHAATDFPALSAEFCATLNFPRARGRGLSGSTYRFKPFL